MRPALRSPRAPDHPGERTPTLLQDLGSVVRLYGTVFWMISQRLQHGRRWEERLAAHTLQHYSAGGSYDAGRVSQHPN